MKIKKTLRRDSLQRFHLFQRWNLYNPMTKWLILGSLFLLAGVAALTIYLQTQHAARAAWFNDSWQYRQAVTITVPVTINI